MIVFVDIMQKLSDAGWSSYRLRRERKLPEGTITRLRHGQPITTETIDVLCCLCNCQPGDLIRYEPGEGERR